MQTDFKSEFTLEALLIFLKYYIYVLDILFSSVNLMCGLTGGECSQEAQEDSWRFLYCRCFQNKWLSVEFLDVTRPLAFLSMLVTLVPPPPRHFTVVLKQSPSLRASHRKKNPHMCFFGNSNLQHILPFFAGRLCEVTNYSAGVSSRKRGLFSGWQHD